MRVLFASTQGAGHFGPLIPFIEACLRRGDDVLVIGPPTLDARGYPFRPGATPPEEKLRPLWERMPSLPPGQGDAVVVGNIFARLNVDAMLPTLGAAIEEWLPDIVVREGNEYASAVAADEHGVPHVRVAVGLALVEEGALAIASPALDQRRPGLAKRVAESPCLTCFPATLDPTTFALERFRDPAVDADAPPLRNWWPNRDGPLVYVSFGSVARSFPPAVQAYAKALEAVSELPARVLLTTGGHDLDLGSAPENVHVERWVQESDVLAHASVVVGHGGAGTTLRVLASGCPLVVVPLFADQPHNATRVAVAHAGVVASLDGIRAGIELLLADDRYAAGARRIAEEMRALPPADVAVEALAGR